MVAVISRSHNAHCKIFLSLNDDLNHNYVKASVEWHFGLVVCQIIYLYRYGLHVGLIDLQF